MIIQKKYIVLLVFLVFALSASAQYKKPVNFNYVEYDNGKRLRFGFSLGINTMDFKVSNSGTDSLFADVSHLVPGFNVNAVSDYRLSENFHLRFLPGYAFGQRNLNFFSPNNKLEKQVKIESSFIELPISIKYSAQRVNNSRPYLLVGGNLRFDLATYKKLDAAIDIVMPRLNKVDAYFEIGFGYDFYLEFFKFSLELKYSMGIFNILSNKIEGIEINKNKKFVNAIDRMNSQLFIVAFHFE